MSICLFPELLYAYYIYFNYRPSSIQLKFTYFRMGFDGCHWYLLLIIFSDTKFNHLLCNFNTANILPYFRKYTIICLSLSLIMYESEFVHICAYDYCLSAFIFYLPTFRSNTYLNINNFYYVIYSFIYLVFFFHFQ